MKEKVLNEIKKYTEFVEGQDGTKGQVVWYSDFEDLAEDIVKLFSNTTKTPYRGKK